MPAGGPTGQLLQAGGNDVGGTLMDENISRAAGSDHGQWATVEDFEHVADSLGRKLAQRTTVYESVVLLDRALGPLTEGRPDQAGNIGNPNDR